MPSPPTAENLHKGFKSAVWPCAFSNSGCVYCKNNHHPDRHPGHESVAVRDGEFLSWILGVEDFEGSGRDFIRTNTFFESCLEFSTECLNAKLSREGKDPGQRIFNPDGSLKVGEAGVDTTNTVSQLKHNGINLLRRYAEMYISVRAQDSGISGGSS